MKRQRGPNTRFLVVLRPSRFQSLAKLYRFICCEGITTVFKTSNLFDQIADVREFVVGSTENDLSEGVTGCTDAAQRGHESARARQQRVEFRYCVHVSEKRANHHYILCTTPTFWAFVVVSAKVDVTYKNLLQR